MEHTIGRYISGPSEKPSEPKSLSLVPCAVACIDGLAYRVVGYRPRLSAHTTVNGFVEVWNQATVDRDTDQDALAITRLEC